MLILRRPVIRISVVLRKGTRAGRIGWRRWGWVSLKVIGAAGGGGVRTEASGGEGGEEERRYLCVRKDGRAEDREAPLEESGGEHDVTSTMDRHGRRGHLTEESKTLLRLSYNGSKLSLHPPTISK